MFVIHIRHRHHHHIILLIIVHFHHHIFLLLFIFTFTFFMFIILFILIIFFIFPDKRGLRMAKIACPWHRIVHWKKRNKHVFPTCQVRVSRFYVSLLFSSSSSFSFPSSCHLALLRASWLGACRVRRLHEIKCKNTCWKYKWVESFFV